MAENNYPIPENPVFNMNIRALQDSDPASASATFNPLIERLIENLCALKLLLDGKVSAETMQGAMTDINNALSGINTTLSGKAPANHGHNAAMAQAAGFMAAADKAKLDGIAAKATANAASTTTPKALGTASAGSEAGFSRGDHVHPKPSPADIGAAAANHSHSGYAGASHNHDAGNITSGILPIARGGLGNDSGYVRAGQKEGVAIGRRATIEGFTNAASGNYAHAEGQQTTAGGIASHTEGYLTKTEAATSHAEGRQTTASGENGHAEGWGTVASGSDSHAQNSGCVASAKMSTAMGNFTTASNFASLVAGKANKAMIDGGTYNNKTGDVFVVGNGSATNISTGIFSNAFRVTYAGQTYGLSAFNTSGADYAEYFEWLDANPEAEDRVGYFVALQGDKICLAQAGDYLLGIVSANPCIIGNADEDWLGRWEHDDFGRFIQIDVETPVTELRHKEVPLLDENGEPTEEIRFETEEVATGEVIHGWDYKQNPDYDSSQQYIERKDRPEWAAVGMLGVLAVRDDGSCQVNGFCQCADGGIATVAEKYIPGQTYRVIARVTENIVKVVFR